jgi:hypothetical protein
MFVRAAIVTLLAIAIAGCGWSSSTSPAERGSHYLRMGQYDDAITALSEAIRANAADADSYFNRGRAHHYRGDTGDLERAVDDFSDVIRLAPKDPEAFYGRSMAYRDLAAQFESAGDQEKAADIGARASEDQTTARRLDPRVNETYSRIPEAAPTPPPAAVETAPAAAPVAESQPTIEDLLNSSRRGEMKPSARPKPAPRVVEEPREDVRDLYRRRQQELAARRKAEAQAAADAQGEDANRTDPEARGDKRRSRSSASRAAGMPREPDLPPALRNPRSAPATSPYAPRNPYGDPGIGGAPSPYRNPYAPRNSRATGFVEDPPPGPYGPAPRTLYDRPASAPSNRSTVPPDYDFERP